MAWEVSWSRKVSRKQLMMARAVGKALMGTSVGSVARRAFAALGERYRTSKGPRAATTASSEMDMMEEGDEKEGMEKEEEETRVRW